MRLWAGLALVILVCPAPAEVPNAPPEATLTRDVQEHVQALAVQAFLRAKRLPSDAILYLSLAGKDPSRAALRAFRSELYEVRPASRRRSDMRRTDPSGVRWLPLLVRAGPPTATPNGRVSVEVVLEHSIMDQDGCSVVLSRVEREWHVDSLGACWIN